MTHISLFPTSPLIFISEQISIQFKDHGPSWVGKPAPHVELVTDSDDSIGIGKILEVRI